MLLKYLDIQGFKSFPDKTRVTFDKGLTAVVGPNGSGKSNISDAVRWVMGEQSTKTLRGAKMEDVIFSGTKSRKAQGFAEVSLTVDNRKREFAIDSDEVTITRKYYRSGDSEYMINRSNVRLKDINEIFMDTGLGKDGYSLVGQGKIAEIVQSKSNERREIFEEAAGISRFRYRKNESERSLQHAEDNLVRLRDILSELEGRIAPLKEQSEKAKKFIELSDSKKTLEVSIWNNTIESSNLSLKNQSDKILVCNNQIEEFDRNIAELEQNIQVCFDKMQQCLVEIDEKRHKKDELESVISEVSSKIAVCQNDIRHNEQNILRIKAELENHGRAVEDTQREIEHKTAELVNLREALQVVEDSIISKQNEILSRSTQTKGYSLQYQELTEQINQMLLEQSQLKMQIAQLESSTEEIQASIVRNDFEYAARVEEHGKYKSELESANLFMGELDDRIQALNNTYSGHKIKLENRMERLEEIKKLCEKVGLEIKEKQQKARLLEGLESNFEGFAYSVKEVLKRAKSGVITGIRGTVSQVIDVKSEYSVAIETALGSSMQNVIVDNEASAKSAIRLLQKDNLGRATFLPLTSVSGSSLQVQGLERYAGYIDIASNLVAFDPKFKPIIESLLGRIVIVDDIDTATVIAQKNGYRFRIVTLDGQVINAGGSFTGGSRNKNQGFLSRKNDIHLLHNQIADLQSEHEKRLRELQSIQAEVSQIQAEYNAVNSEIRTANEDKIRTASEQKRLEQMLAQAQQLNMRMESELNSRKQRIESNQAELLNKRSSLSQLNEGIAKISDEIRLVEQSNQGSAELQTKLGEELSVLKIRTIEMSKDIQAAEGAIEELKRQSLATGERTKALENEKLEVAEKSRQIEAYIEDLQNGIGSNREQISSIQREIEQISKRRQELEGRTTELRKDVREATEQKQKISAEAVRLEERLLAIQKEYDDIIKKLWEEYELTKTEAQAIAVEIDSIPKASTELNSIKSRIRGLGSVNVAAIEEYKEVSERYEFLSAQVKDAERSRNELLRLIGELTHQMQEIFEENFNRINENFRKIFVELFGGGRADLKLTDPDNILESGIEIFVEPPGKIIKNLASLSGGEQSFIAIAIYFAILKVRPAPFCILDEIEAALDDVNVYKYANYLRNLTDQTQFIMITHRRGSMEAADVLYGVTMQEEGVSKLLQLKVSEIEKSNILQAD